LHFGINGIKSPAALSSENPSRAGTSGNYLAERESFQQYHSITDMIGVTGMVGWAGEIAKSGGKKNWNTGRGPVSIKFFSATSAKIHPPAFIPRKPG
jgi:hypothetical protein